MIYGNALIFDVGRRRMAPQASSQRLALGATLEVAKVTGAGGHCQVLPLNDLGMAGSAS
jgi:hypothetical protein